MSRPALAASRAIGVLNFLASRPTEAFTLSDIVSHVGINVASAHALLAVLTDAGYLARHPRHRTYVLGPALVAVGNAALEQHPALDAARNEARKLAQELEVEVAVTVRAGTDILFVARAGRHRPHGVPRHVGQRVPLSPPLGSVFVAWSGATEIDAWFSRAPEPLSGEARAGYVRVLDSVRSRGYSVGLDDIARRALSDSLESSAEPDVRPVDELLAELGHGEYQLGDLDRSRTYDVSMVAAPVFGAGGEVTSALTLVGFAPALDAEQIAEYGERVRGAALVVTKRTHGREPVPS